MTALKFTFLNGFGIFLMFCGMVAIFGTDNYQISGILLGLAGNIFVNIVGLRADRKL